MPTSAGLFDTWQDAERAVAELERLGFSKESIKLVTRGERSAAPGGPPPGEGAVVASRAGAVAAGGAAIGGMTGLLAGLSTFAVPGLGPVLTAGAAVTILGSAAAGAGVGAAAGGLIGAIYGMGVAEEDAGAYAEGVSGDGVLLSVETGEARSAEADEILRAAGAADMNVRRRMGRDEMVTSDKDPATIIGDYPPHDSSR
ncbi:MAG: hypothetical protein M3498_12295 [Deinococcota bacterium]|nr:hypothetical protein [Deinococcota bacterium]